MEVTLEIPNFVLGVGDKVSIKNEHNKHSINVVVTGGSMRGSWNYGLGKGTNVWIGSIGTFGTDVKDDGLDTYYTTTILPDSYTDSVPPKKLEPNTCITWSKSVLEARGEKQEE